MAAGSTDSTLISGLFFLPIAAADGAGVAVRESLAESSGFKVQSSKLGMGFGDGEGTPAESLASASGLCGEGEAFVAGPENAVVRVLAAAVSGEELGYNPIVLCGPAGVGKSSVAGALAGLKRSRFKVQGSKLGLLADVNTEVGRAHPTVIETTGAEVAQGLASAIETGSVDEFRARFHGCDLLVIDDLHRIVGKAAAQQFLVAAIDALVERGSLVVVTMPKLPQATKGLMPALASRLAGGLVLKLALPGERARREVVRQEAERRSLVLDEEQIGRLADQDDGSFVTARQLRRAVMGLAANSEFRIQNSVLGEAGSKVQSPKSKVGDVCRRVAMLVGKQFGVTLAELRGKSRRQAIVEARSLAMHVVRGLTGASFAAIGREFGNRDHTTVLHACRKAADAVEQDEFVRGIAEEILTQVAVEG